MHPKCAAVVALFVFSAAMLSACTQSNQSLETVSAADQPSTFRSAPGWTSSDNTVNRVRPLRSDLANADRGDARMMINAVTATPAPSPTPRVRQMPTVTPTVEADCNWMWAYQELPDITIRVSSALDAAGIPYSNVSAQTLGENCLSVDGQAQYFAPLETDYEITIPVRSLDDHDALGDQAAAVLFLLNHQFPTDSTPGPIAGQIKLTFTARGEMLRLVIQQEEAEAALASKLRGSALLAALDH